MKNLDDIDALKKLDPKGVLDSISLFPKQSAQAWEETSALTFPDEYRKVKNVVVCGMGGSRFTPKTIKELFRDRIRTPYVLVEDYTLPGFVGPETLVILSSYSGTTEEVIACGNDALKRNAKVTAVSLGGSLKDMSRAHGFLGYFFDPIHNPCGQPRVGGGYMLFGHIGVLSACGLLNIENSEVVRAIDHASKTAISFAAANPEMKNPAKQIANALYDTHPFIITSEFLRGFGNGFANQINENAKMISDYRHIPELNHHLMEGLSYPDSLHKNGLFVFITSPLYSPPVQKRYRITMDVVKKQHVKTMEIPIQAKDKLAAVLESFTISGYATFYLAARYHADPVTVPWVDYFKAELAKT